MTAPGDRLRRNLGDSDVDAALLASERGLVAEELLVEWLRARESGPGRPLDAILPPGTDIESLRREVRMLQVRDLVDAAARRPPSEVAAAEDLPGRRLGKYVLVNELGRGGMAVVYRAWQTDIGRWVAVKRLSANEGTASLRFFQEARLAARLQHPHLVPVFEVGDDEREPFIAMALIEGGSLAGRTLAPPEALRAVAAAARAAHAAHQAGIVHRDIKPGNLLVDGTGHVYLADFGLARPVTGAGLSRTGVLLGTLGFAAPEQIRGASDVGPAADVYSLGATLYALLSGRPPFDGSDAAAVLEGTLRRDPAPLRRLVPGLHPDIETICGRAMRRDPAERYPSAEALAVDIERYLSGRGILARPPSRTSRALAAVGRRWGTIALALAASLAAAGVTWISTRTPPPAVAPAKKDEGRRDTALLALKEASTLLDLARKSIQGAVPDTGGYVSRLERARQLAADARRLDPDLPDVHFIGGELAAELDLSEETEELLGEHLRRAPDDARALHLRGRLLLRRAMMEQHPLGDGVMIPGVRQRLEWLDRAAEDWNRAARAGGPAYQEDDLVTATRLLVQGKAGEAAAACDARLSRPRAPAEVHLVKGIGLHLSTGREEEAVAHLDRAQELDPADPLPRYGRALAFRMQRRFDDCLRELDAVHLLRPRFVMAWACRLEIEMDLGRLDAALATLDRILDLPGARPGMWITKLEILLRMRRFGEAERTVAELPDGFRELGGGILAIARGAPVAEQLPFFDAAVQKAPACVQAHLYRANALADLDRLPEALAECNRIFETGATWIGWTISATRGRIYQRMGEFAAAEADLTRAIRGTMPNAGLFTRRGEVRMSLRRPGMAERDFQAALDLDPNHAAALLGRGRLRLVQMRRAEAEKDLRRALELNPSLEGTIRPLLERAAGGN